MLLVVLQLLVDHLHSEIVIFQWEGFARTTSLGFLVHSQGIVSYLSQESSRKWNSYVTKEKKEEKFIFLMLHTDSHGSLCYSGVKDRDWYKASFDKANKLKNDFIFIFVTDTI